MGAGASSAGQKDVQLVDYYQLLEVDEGATADEIKVSL